MYTNTAAMQGAVLSNSLERILWDYEHRRAEMPGSSEELLDELWIVNLWIGATLVLGMVLAPFIVVYYLFWVFPKHWFWANLKR